MIVFFCYKIKSLHSFIMTSKDFECGFCKSTRSFNKFCDYFRHMTLRHSSEPNFKLTSEISGSCGVTYKTFTSYKMHIHLHHKLLLNPSLQQEENNIKNEMNALLIQQGGITTTKTCICLNQDDFNAIELDMNSEDFTDDWEMPIQNNSYADNKIDLSVIHRIYIRFLLQMREQHILPQMVIQSITTHIVNLLDSVMELIVEQAKQENVVHQQTTAIISIDNIRKIVKQIEESIILSTLSEYQFLQLCK